MMLDLDDKIRRLRGEGVSLRAIATELGLSHEGVRKRLKRIKSEDQGPNGVTGKELTQALKDKAISHPGSKAHKSKASGQGRFLVNQMSTQAPPSTNPTEGVNQPQTASEKPETGKIEPSLGVSPGIDDSITAIKDFFECYGIEVYPMQCEPEAYQVKHNGQVIRFYVHRDKEMN
jgi:hypothetical protein